MNIKFDRIDTKSGMDGLVLLKEISNDQDSFGESPVPKEINEYFYRGFLLLSEEESKLDDESPCDRYWVLLDDKKIGYADIKHCLDDESRRIGGELSDIDGHCHYWFKNNKKIYK